jgi:hypothetical protein
VNWIPRDDFDAPEGAFVLQRMMLDTGVYTYRMWWFWLPDRRDERPETAEFLLIDERRHVRKLTPGG